MGIKPAIERIVTVTNKMGLHARPAAELAKLAGSFDAEMVVERIDSEDAEPTDGRSILGLLMLAAGQGAQLKLLSSGPDGEQLVNAAAALFDRKFGEEE